MENENQLSSKKKKILIIAGVVIVLAVVATIILNIPNKDVGPDTEGQNNNQVNTGQQDQSGDNVNNGQDGEGGEPVDDDMNVVEPEEVNPVLEGAVTQAPGADLITTDGRVVNQQGEEVRSDVEYNSPEAPRQTQNIENEEEIIQANKLTLTADGFEPEQFRVGAGEAVTVALTGSEDSSHVFAFEDDALSAVYINVRPGETRAVTFNAPQDPGEYTFFCDFPGHRARGEQGVMIVE